MLASMLQNRQCVMSSKPCEAEELRGFSRLMPNSAVFHERDAAASPTSRTMAAAACKPIRQKPATRPQIAPRRVAALPEHAAEDGRRELRNGGKRDQADRDQRVRFAREPEIEHSPASARRRSRRAGCRGAAPTSRRARAGAAPSGAAATASRGRCRPWSRARSFRRSPCRSRPTARR